MADTPSNFSQQSARKTLIFVIVLLSLAVITACIAIYMLYKQSSVLVL